MVAKVISIFIVIVGLIAVKILPITQFPEIVPPTIQVSANYTGGSAEVVEKSVTLPIEERLNGVEGMIYMDSIPSSDGSSTIKVYFELGYDLDIAAVDVQNRVALATPVLPDTVKQTGVSTKKLSTSMVQIVTVQSSNPKHDALFLSNFASLNILEELQRIDGVGDVQNMGERKYSMRIWVDPDKLSALGKIGETSLVSQNKFQLNSLNNPISPKEWIDLRTS